MKKYRLSSLLVTFVLALTLLAPFSALAAAAPHITSRHAVLMDANYGEILYEKAAREKAYPASITKVMTALLVSEAIDRGELSQDQMITVSSTSQFDLSADGSTANLKPGEVISVKDLMYCLLLPSANEAANILAEAVCGNVASFIELMNQRARELGCTGTHFANTHGLHDDDHYTTAYDICLFTREALKHDLIREVVGTSVYTVPATNLSEPREFYNTNALLSNWHYMGYVYDKAIGVKTGTTPEAGRCLVSAAVDGDEYLIAVILGAEPAVREDGSTDLKQFSESTALLKWGFRNFQRTTISQEDTPVAAVNVTLSQDANQVLVKPVGTLERTLPVDMDLEAIEPTISLFQDTVEAPVKEGQVMGTMTLTYDGEVFGTLDLVATTSVDRSELLYRQEQIRQFFANSGTKLILAAVLVVAVLVLLRLLVFRKRRRYRAGAGAGGRRGSYHGRRRR